MTRRRWSAAATVPQQRTVAAGGGGNFGGGSGSRGGAFQGVDRGGSAREQRQPRGSASRGSCGGGGLRGAAVEAVGVVVAWRRTGAVDDDAGNCGVECVRVISDSVTRTITTSSDGGSNEFARLESKNRTALLARAGSLRRRLDFQPGRLARGGFRRKRRFLRLKRRLKPQWPRQEATTTRNCSRSLALRQRKFCFQGIRLRTNREELNSLQPTTKRTVLHGRRR